jgi:L-ascorbate metabolism protein UlaG (beta-lactamase superfamily)
MKKIFQKTLRVLLIGLLAILLLGGIGGALFLNLSPEFGGSHSEADKTRYLQSGHYENGIFVNETPTSMDMSFANMKEPMKKMLAGVPNQTPGFELPVIAADPEEVAANRQRNRLMWFGHSAFLLQLDGKNILLDPMLGMVPAPHPWFGQKRYFPKLPITLEDLPPIDAIVISHDHYDHLDYGSIKKLEAKTREFYVPLGVGAHFRAWGIAEERIHEMNWWDEADFEGIKLAFAPSRHFSGRGISDRSATLWGSWVILGQEDSLYFSGDGGYGPHFKEIGEKYGPFDFAMMECGQYNKSWSQIHMMPEETAQAAVDISARLMMPIHWGAFTLAVHAWNEPPERASKKAAELSMPFITPKIGEYIEWNAESPASSDWWKGK